ncbi:SapC family protein [Sphingopyxis sp.]|uniref:SapC family protein n=1 Tax=Sphingopyxis sp. TaxID=1908224 RepID=UPI002D796EFB|nr:SapC family protein [Sphingopyxis sp.]HET6523562.1 SapC family protein [Sphingopyxis sp.]
MASAAQSATLPLFYKDLTPVNVRDHGTWRSRTTDKASWLAAQHVVPLTVEEFAEAQRHYPIIFSVGDDPVPLALMGLNDGVNVFVEADGSLAEAVYIPAYVRRYPFMLARISPESSDLSLCFDATTDLVGDFADGSLLFDGNAPSEACRSTLQFCEQFEMAGQKTGAFMAELVKHGLLMDGELTVQPGGESPPFVYRGFQMIDETKFRDLDAEVLREWSRNGALPLIIAHLFSLNLMSKVFDRQHPVSPAGALAPRPRGRSAAR